MVKNFMEFNFEFKLPFAEETSNNIIFISIKHLTCWVNN